MAKEVSFKKVFGIVRTVLIWIVFAIAIFMMLFTLISVNTFNKGDKNLFGFKFFVVQTDSMAATDFNAGDLIVVREVDLTTLKEGDIITFISQDKESYGETITHKIRKVTTDENGDIAFVTYGTTTGVDDETLATMIVGKYQSKLPKVGSFFLFLKTTPGYIICILIPFLLLILSQGINCVRLFRRYKEEQMEEMQAERDKIEAERAENQKMMEELLALKSQLAAQGNATATPEKEVAQEQTEAQAEEVPAEQNTETK